MKYKQNTKSLVKRLDIEFVPLQLEFKKFEMKVKAIRFPSDESLKK